MALSETVNCAGPASFGAGDYLRLLWGRGNFFGRGLIVM